jgi:hypothetical protein
MIKPKHARVVIISDGGGSGSVEQPMMKSTRSPPSSAISLSKAVIDFTLHHQHHSSAVKDGFGCGSPERRQSVSFLCLSCHLSRKN